MLKNRLLFGTLMVVGFASVAVLDGWLDGSLTSAAPDKPVQGTILAVLVAALAIPAQVEFARLAAAKGFKVFTAVGVVASILLATSWYWPQLVPIQGGLYLAVVLALTLPALALYQCIFYGTGGAIANCGASLLGICYLGLLSSFVLAIRVRFGLWALLMFISVVKSSDIGAWTAGKLFGRHKFSPRVSPGKTWEGMAGAWLLACAVAVLFGLCCAIMDLPRAVAFGICLAFLGQMGDLVESMMKRDAEQKDSATTVPGFGGVLDIIDSPLVAAPFGYLFLVLLAR